MKLHMEMDFTLGSGVCSVMLKSVLFFWSLHLFRNEGISSI